MSSSSIGRSAETSSTQHFGFPHSSLVGPSTPVINNEAFEHNTDCSSSCVSPKNFQKELITLHLPFGVHSTLEVKPGVFARDAIIKILMKRDILPQMCKVVSCQDPDSKPIDLNVDLEALSNSLGEKKELWVHSPYLSFVVSLQHDFVRKTFLTWTFCDVCGKQIWLQGFRCELCQFKFHQKCSSKVPNYCDRMQQISNNPEMANKLKAFVDQYGGPNAAVVAEIITQFQSPNAELSSGGEITRQRAVRLPPQRADAAGVPMTESSRDRSTSAPNIYEISKNNDPFLEAVASAAPLTDFACSMSVPNRSCDNRNLKKPCGFPTRDWHIGGLRQSSRLYPTTATNMSSPTSTSSSPPPIAGVLGDPSVGLPPTPPQSAPPQKTYSFSRFRSKSKS
uniref:non-specific serine/threonine protein kinase n=1 Tax=Syphacia muris TaxID=451379 RepID=A0A0N5APQ1_9BILA